MGRWITTECIHPENGLNEVSRYQLSVPIFQPSPVHQKARKESTSDGEEGRGAWNRFKSHSLPVLHCLERIEWIYSAGTERERERERKKSIYLSHPATKPSHRRTASCWKQSGRSMHPTEKESPDASIFFFIVSPLTPGNKTCKVAHAKHRIYRASPHLTTPNVQE